MSRGKMPGEDPVAFVKYYARAAYGHHILSICFKHPDDPQLHFWEVYGKVVTKCPAQSIVPDLNLLKEQSESRLAALIAELHLFSGDKGRLQLSQSYLEAEEKCANEKALLLGATTAFLFGDGQSLQRAKRFTSRVLKSQPDCLEAKTLHAWILLETGSVESAAQTLDEVLESDAAYLDARMGKAACYERLGKYKLAVVEVDAALASHPWFFPAFCEKGKLAMLLQDWKLMLQASEQLLDKDPDNIDGLRLRIHVLMCYSNDMASAVTTLGDLLTSLEKKEPNNARLYLQFACPIARLAGRGAPNVINRTLSLVEKSHKLEPDNGAHLLELANQLFLLGDYTAAITSYRLASKADKVRAQALCGVTQCLLIFGSLKEAANHLNELENSADFTYLKAQLLWLKNSSYVSCRELLFETVDMHLKGISEKKDYQFLTELNPDKLLGIAELCLTMHKYEPKECFRSGEFGLFKPAVALEAILSAIPGFVSAHLILAYTFAELGKLESAGESVQTVLSLDSSCATAYMLLVQIHLEQGDTDSARQYLEQASNDDFTIRESLQYYILLAKILIHDEQLEQALLVLESAISLPCIKLERNVKLSYYTTGCKMYLNTTNADRATVYSLLSKVYVHMKNYSEATRIIEDAKKLFSGRPEEAHIVIANSHLLVAGGDVEAALVLLQEIQASSNYFPQARAAMADIYLNIKHDKARFISSFSELAELFPSSKMHVMLGDALMRVNEPSRAIKPYEVALKENHKDTSVIRKLGKALSRSHDYHRAIAHYETALVNVASAAAVHLDNDLAELCIELEQYDKAERAAKESVAILEFLHNKPNKLLLKALFLLLKAQACQEKHGPSSEAVLKLKGFLKHTAVSERESYLIDACISFAQVCEERKDYESARHFFNEAIKSTSVPHSALAKLSRIQFLRGELSECEVSCAAVLKSNPSSLEGAKMFVNVLLQRELHDVAFTHFHQILQREPTCYRVLAQFINFLRRQGRLEEAQSYIQKAEKASPSSRMDAGLVYCKGIQARYVNSFYEAVTLLNQARQDEEWSKPAICVMLEIYMNIDETLLPDEELYGGTTRLEAEDMATAQELLCEIRYPDTKTLAWESYLQMVAGQKSEVEAALSRLNEAAAKDKDQVFIMLCIAVALLILKQIAKAKAQLRSIDRLTYNFEEGDNFERTWLILANMHIQAGKLDVAEQLCKKCLRYNKSSSKAWEWLGLIMEKGHAYSEAAVFYENAWRYHRESSPSVGYKLAFAYLKSRRYTDAIVICHKVLKASPDNARIRKDVLDKARRSLRP